MIFFIIDVSDNNYSLDIHNVNNGKSNLVNYKSFDELYKKLVFYYNQKGNPSLKPSLKTFSPISINGNMFSLNSHNDLLSDSRISLVQVVYYYNLVTDLMLKFVYHHSLYIIRM
jgi:hypothetical protein